VKTLTESKGLRYTTLGALYFAQGVPWGFVAVAYVVFLADQGLSKSAIGETIAWAYLPWTFKLLAGPIIDRFPTRRFGRRRHFIVTAELLMGLTLLSLPWFDPRTELVLINAALFVHNCFAAIQDVATDGLAVDVLPVDERGKANSVMWAAKAGGSALGGSVGVVLAKYLGWTALFVSNAVLVWAIMLVVIFVRERPPGPQADKAAEQHFDLRVLWRSFAFPAPLFGIVIAMLAPAGYAIATMVYTAVLRTDLKLSSDAIASLTFIDTPVGVGGALLGGFAADRFGQRKAMGTFMAGLAISLAVFAAAKSWWASLTFLAAFQVMSSLCQYAYGAASLGFFMTLSNPAVGATQFAVYMAGTNLTYAWTAKLGGHLTDTLGIAQTFAIAAAIQLAAILLLPLCNQRTAEARFRGHGQPVGIKSDVAV
jgi:PAT family beta-lactamase induction signal transducer AmpG